MLVAAMALTYNSLPQASNACLPHQMLAACVPTDPCLPLALCRLIDPLQSSPMDSFSYAQYEKMNEFLWGHMCQAQSAADLKPFLDLK